MYGEHTGSLKVGATTATEEWIKQGEQGNVWRKGQLEITKQNEDPFRVRICSK